VTPDLSGVRSRVRDSLVREGVRANVLPLPLLYEAVARGAAERLTPAECHVVYERVYWR
jgi:hypothetical protein